MRSTHQFTITLPDDLAKMVKAKVMSGEYASESDVVCDGLRALQEHDKALEHWLRTEVVAAYDELKADPSRGLSVEQVREHLAEKRKVDSSV